MSSKGPRLVPIETSDLRVNECGQFVPPPGYLFVPLFRIIPFAVSAPGTAESLPTRPFTTKFNNNANTTFVCCGLMSQASTSYRIKWPNGHYFNASFQVAGNTFPQGTAGNGLALNAPQVIGRGARIAVELPGGGVDVALQLWGYLLYMVKVEDCGANTPETTCIVGYPAAKGGEFGERIKSFLVDSPMEVFGLRPRYYCAAANIQANEVQLSNQCGDLNDESLTFFSETISLGPNETSFGNVILVPGASDVVLKAWRPIVSGGETTSEPTFALQFPNGYSMTGGDLIPVTNLGWTPIFPSMRVRAGDRLVFDVSNINGVLNDEDVTLKIEFSAVRRGAR